MNAHPAATSRASLRRRNRILNDNPHAPAVQREAEDDWGGDPRKIAHELQLVVCSCSLCLCQGRWRSRRARRLIIPGVPEELLPAVLARALVYSYPRDAVRP